jgi:PKD repeat protein
LNNEKINGRGREIRKSPSSPTGKASVLSMMVLVLVGAILFAGPSTAMAQQQQQQQTTTTAETSPLTPEEREEENRLQNVTTAITRNLQQGEMQVNGIVYTPRWSNPVWVQPNSLSVLFEYCLPGEFADSGQQILGGSELDVLESYSVALSSDLTGWLIVVENEHQTDRIPAAIGVICASDANDPETRVLTEQEQTEIKNIVQQFITIRNIQKTNITQVINIINNITTNQTGGGGGNNQTGNQTNGGGGNQTSPLSVILTRDIGDGTQAPALWSLEADAHGGVPPYTYSWDFGDGTTGEGCCPDHWYESPGEYVTTATATDAVGNTGSDSVRIRVDTPIRLSVVVTAELIEGPEAPATYSLRVLLHDPVSNRSESDYTYHWHFGDGESSDTTTRTTTHTYENPGVYFPEVTVTDPEGNTARNEGEPQLRIVVPAEFEVQITRDIQDGTEAPSTWCFEPSIVTGAEGVPPYRYSWLFEDGASSEDREVCHTFEQPGDYEVELRVYDSLNTLATAITTIRVLPPLETTTPPTANETAPETEQPATTEGETTTTPPGTTTEEEEGAATTDTITETPPSATEGEAGAPEELPSGTTATTTGGEDATTPP